VAEGWGPGQGKGQRLLFSACGSTLEPAIKGPLVWQQQAQARCLQQQGWFGGLVAVALAIAVLLGFAPASAAGLSGAELFSNHCAGCHVNGGNVMRRGQTLKLAALERHGIDGPEAISAIAAAGRGQMSGYGSVLGEGGADAVAAYVWQQALLDWPRG
jgi:cytochrome c6